MDIGCMDISKCIIKLVLYPVQDGAVTTSVSSDMTDIMFLTFTATTDIGSEVGNYNECKVG